MQGDVADVLAPARIAELSPQLRRAARFVVDNPGEIATRSLRHIAETAQLPPPTFSRLAKAVGYDSYNSLKESCRLGVLGRQGKDQEGLSVIADHGLSAIKGIERLLREIDEKELENGARVLAGARRVALIGEMRARALVDYASYLSDMTIDGLSVIGRDPVSLAAETRDLGAKDAAVVLTMNPYATRSIETAKLVSATGAYLISITDSPLSPVAEISDQMFVISPDGPQFFPSYVVATLIIETLFGLMVREKGADAHQRIKDTARRCRELGEYWKD